jgi:hypothetical protein
MFWNFCTQAIVNIAELLLNYENRSTVVRMSAILVKKKHVSYCNLLFSLLVFGS